MSNARTSVNDNGYAQDDITLGKQTTPTADDKSLSGSKSESNLPWTRTPSPRSKKFDVSTELYNPSIFKALRKKVIDHLQNPQSKATQVKLSPKTPPSSEAPIVGEPASGSVEVPEQINVNLFQVRREQVRRRLSGEIAAAENKENCQSEEASRKSLRASRS